MQALIDVLNTERAGGGLSDRLITRQIASLYEKVLQVGEAASFEASASTDAEFVAFAEGTVYCLLYTVSYAVYCLLFTVSYAVSYAVYCVLCAVCCVLCAVYCMLCTVYCILFTVCCVLYAVCCVLWYCLLWYCLLCAV